MKAMVYKRYGGPEVLELVELPEPKVGQSTVMVQVKAAGLNPADVGMRAGAGDSVIEGLLAQAVAANEVAGGT